MSRKELLVQYMEVKAKRLGSIDPSLEPLYFTKEDRNSLTALSEDKAERIWEELVRNITSGHHGLSPKVCPFCLFDLKLFKLPCQDCPYALSHKDCTNEGSDYSSILKRLKELEIDVEDLFSPDFYLSALIRIAAPLLPRTSRDYLLVKDVKWRSENGEEFLLIANKEGGSFKGVMNGWRWGNHAPPDKEHFVIKLYSLISGKEVKKICWECDLDIVYVSELV